MAVKFCEHCGVNVKLPHLVCKRKTEMKKQTLYAFWDYDLCPYMLGGELIEFTDTGNIRAKGYDGMSFKPIAILPGQTGKDALKLLKELRHNYSKQEKELKTRFKEAARGLVGLE